MKLTLNSRMSLEYSVYGGRTPNVPMRSTTLEKLSDKILSILLYYDRAGEKDISEMKKIERCFYNEDEKFYNICYGDYGYWTVERLVKFL